jgi:hypothetical protein
VFQIGGGGGLARAGELGHRGGEGAAVGGGALGKMLWRCQISHLWLRSGQSDTPS